MADTVLVPAASTVFVHAVANTLRTQRIELSASGYHQVWEGRGRGNALLGTCVLSQGVDIFSPITVRIFSRTDAAEWEESKTVLLIHDCGNCVHVWIGSEGGNGDGAYHGVVVSFLWAKYSRIFEMLCR